MAEDDDLRAGVEDLLGQFGSLLDKAKPKDSVVKSTSSAKPAPEKNASQKPVSKAAPAPPVMPVRKYNKAGPFLVASEKQEKEEAVFGLNTAPVTANGAQSERRNARPFEQTKPNNDISKPKEKKSNQNLSAPSTTLDSQIDFAALSASKMTGKLCDGEGCWFDHVPPVPSAEAVPAATEAAPAGQSLKRKREAEPPRISLPVLDRLFSLGQKLLAAEEAAGDGKGGKQGAAAAGGDEAWMRSVLQSGTAGDKLAALTLLVARHPMSSGRHLDSLLALAGKKSRRESQAAMDALKDVFINNLLPPDRRLLPFISKQRAQHAAALLGDAGGTGVSAAHLVFWTWEDSLSKRFAKFIECLASHAADGITHFKLHALATANELLQSRPEGEAALLQLLAHKIGDKENKVASRAVYLLLKTAEAHPAMAPVLARAVQQVVLDPSASESQVYYGITFLNQIPLKRDSPAHSTLATKLIETYFTLFEHSVGAGKLEAKLLSALLVGVNRAVPYAPSDGAATATLEAKADSVFTVVHKGTFAASVQALTLLQHVAQRKMELVAAGGASAPAAGDTFVDRFYRALYGQLDAVLLSGTNKHALFLNLLFRAIKADTHAPRARAVMKRLCACALHMSAPFAAGVVLLVGEVLRKRPDLLALLTQPEGSVAAQAGREAATEAAQQLQQTNEVEKGIESGSMDAGVARRDKAAALAALDAAMEEEEEDGGDEDAPVLHMQVKAIERSKAPVPAVAAAAVTAQAPSVVELDVSRTGVYDPLKREPKYAGAERACLWEIGPLASHFHPSVRLFADRVLSRALDGSLASEGVGYEGDPLADFTLIAFLDRLAYKNPKKRDIAAYGSKEEKDKAGIRTPSFGPGGATSAEDDLAAGYAEVQGLTSTAGERALAMGLVRGTSVMQKKGARHGRADVAAPANSSAFLRTEASAVPVEEAFLHSYFSAKAAQDEAAGRKSRRTEEDAGDADGDASDAESESSLFAQELAEKLLRSADPDADIDDDLGGYESDEGEEGEQQQEEGEGGDGLDDEEEDEDDSGIDEFDENGELIEDGHGGAPASRSATGGVRKGELDDSEEEEEVDEDSEEEARPRASKGAKQRVPDGEDDEDDEMDEEDFLDEEDEDDGSEGEAGGKAAATQGGKKRGDSVFAAADDFADVLASDSEGSDASGDDADEHRRKRSRKRRGSSDEEDDEDSDDDERRGKKPAFKWGQKKEADLYSDDDDGDGDSAPARRGRGGGRGRGRGGSRGAPPRGRGGPGARGGGGRGGFRGGKGPSGGGGARPFARGRGGRGRR